MEEADRLLEKKYKKLQDYLNGLKRLLLPTQPELIQRFF